MNNIKIQVDEFRTAGGNPISVGIVEINRARQFMSRTEGDICVAHRNKGQKHRVQEAAEAEASDFFEKVAPIFDEFLILQYPARNETPLFLRMGQQSTDTNGL